MQKVLVVEDQPGVAQALQMLFDLHDIATVVASTPRAAVEALSRGDIALVLQDMNFTPGATAGDEGVALFRRMRGLDRDLPILLMTAWTSLETAVQLVKEGAADYMAKPWDDAKLVTTVKALLVARESAGDADRARRQRERSQGHPARTHDTAGLVFVSDAMNHVVTLATRIAASDVPVLITGPNGVGKEKIAEIIHASSGRRTKPFVKLNCGAIPDELMESELFGAEPGAFTGATRTRLGRFESAHRGTIFLDEIGTLSPAGQAKLLRVLQTGEFQRLGSSETHRVDVRVLCATNANLQQAIVRGTFRQDLYFRIAVVEIAVPPLCERREDILPLARAFLGDRALTASAEAALVAYGWPGNVRELQNRVRRALTLSTGDEITPEDLGFGVSDTRPEEEPLERSQLEMALLNANGSVSRAAETLGLSRQSLYRRMEKLGIVLEKRPRGN